MLFVFICNNLSKNKQKFEQFYNTNLNKLYRFVFFRIGQDKQLAEDLVSEIFMKALENFERYDEKISTSAWLFTIAKNHLANHWRDTRPTQSLSDSDEGKGEDLFWAEGSMKEFKKMALLRELNEFLLKLTPEERQIVTFHYLFGYSYLEIAEMMNSTEGAVKVATHRAMKKIKLNLSF